MKRRDLFAAAALLPLASPALAQGGPFRRVLPGDAGWPSAAEWQRLSEAVGGQLVEPRSPLAACRAAPDSEACARFFREMKNPWAIGDSAALTQTSGWVDAWSSQPSAYAVAARHAGDVAAAVDFARRHRLRLAVKGGGHSYQGTSNAAGSLLVWTRPMNRVELHDAFVPQGCSGPPQPAISLGAGTVWLHAYAAAAQAGRYVQGGGCATVNVAGLVQSGGFGTFSKQFGMASAGLLEAEVVTADGAVRIVNACREPDLFWALKGGGGGSFGVVTRVTLRTHPLPETFGGIFATVRATSDDAFRRLIARFVAFYRERLFNPNWGEQATVRPDNALEITMVFQGLSEAAANATWKPFLDAIAAEPASFRMEAPPLIVSVPARHFWDAAWMKANARAFVLDDDRPGAPGDNIFWRGNLGEAGWFLHGYESSWLPASLIEPAGQARLVEALFAGSRHWRIGLHFNKGLAGGPAVNQAEARDTATNPAVADAFALAISAASGPPAFAGIPGHEPDLAKARDEARRVTAAMDAMRRLAPRPASYVSEASFFGDDWREAYWGDNYPRLRAVKERVDPDGLFTVHHGVGSEDWSPDGLTRLR